MVRSCSSKQWVIWFLDTSGWRPLAWSCAQVCTATAGFFWRNPSTRLFCRLFGRADGVPQFVFRGGRQICQIIGGNFMGQLSMYTICHTWSVWQFGIYFSSRFFQFLTSLGSSFGIGVRQVTLSFRDETCSRCRWGRGSSRSFWSIAS